MRFLFMIVLLFSFRVFAAPTAVDIKTQTVVTATTTSTVALAENKERRYLLIQNNGAVTVYVKFGAAHSGTEGVWIIAGGNYEPFQAPLESIYVKSASSTAAVTIIEAN